jgi:cell division control protein 6
VIVLVDELDYLVKNGKDSVVYSLTRLSEALPEVHCNVIGLIFAGRSIDYGELLDRAELSSLGRLGPRFEPYGREEIHDILATRAREAFHAGGVDGEVLTLIADLTVAPPICSDIRYALELLYYAGKTADNRGGARVLPEHVREAHELAAPPFEEHEVVSLPDKQLLGLLAILEGARTKGKPSLAFDEIVTAHDSIRSQYRFKKLTLKDVVRVVQDLCDRGLVEARGLQEIRTRRIAPHGSAKFAALFQQLASEAKRRASEPKP